MNAANVDLESQLDAARSTLKLALESAEEVKLLELGTRIRDAVGILLESGEAELYRNDNSNLCVRYHKPSVVRRLFG